MESLEIPPEINIVSYGVTTLFISFPLILEKTLIRDLLTLETTLMGIWEISVDQTLLYYSARTHFSTTTCYSYDAMFYKQTE